MDVTEGDLSDRHRGIFQQSIKRVRMYLRLEWHKINSRTYHLQPRNPRGD